MSHWKVLCSNSWKSPAFKNVSCFLQSNTVTSLNCSVRPCPGHGAGLTSQKDACIGQFQLHSSIAYPARHRSPAAHVLIDKSCLLSQFPPPALEAVQISVICVLHSGFMKTPGDSSAIYIVLRTIHCPMKGPCNSGAVSRSSVSVLYTTDTIIL